MKTTMQVSVPASIYDNQFFMPSEMEMWVSNLGLQYRYAGSSSTVDGYRYINGVSTKENTYIVDNIDPTDASAFKIQFPDCRVYTRDLETTN